MYTARFTPTIGAPAEYVEKAAAIRADILKAAAAIQADFAENWQTLHNMAAFYQLSYDLMNALYYEPATSETRPPALTVSQEIRRGITPYQAEDISRALQEQFGLETGEYLDGNGCTWDEGEDNPAEFYEICTKNPEQADAVRFLLRTLYPDWDPVDTSDHEGEAYEAFCNGRMCGVLMSWEKGFRSGFLIPLTESPDIE